jgi:hypothetical protein
MATRVITWSAGVEGVSRRGPGKGTRTTPDKAAMHNNVGPFSFSRAACMNRSTCAAAKLPESERRKLAVRAVAGSETVIDLAARDGVSRKFVYAQKGRANDALKDVFCSSVVDDAS